MRSGIIALVLFLALSGGALVLWVYRVNGAMPLLTDEVVLLWQAVSIARGELTTPSPADPSFVNVPSIVLDGDRRFGQYPSGYPLALAPWAAAGIPWALNVLLGVASLALMFRFASRIDGIRTAWLCIVLLALSPFFIAQSTVFFMQPLLLMLTLLMLVALHARESAGNRSGWSLVAGLAIGYAINVSPFTAIALLLTACLRFLVVRKSAPLRPHQAIAFGGAVLAGIVACCAVNWSTTGSPWMPPYYASDPSVRAGFGAEVGAAGHSLARALFKTMQRVRLLNEFLFGWPLTSFWFAGLYLVFRASRAVRRLHLSERPVRHAAGGSGADASLPVVGRLHTSWDETLLTLFVGTTIVFMFWYFHGNGPSWGPRYLYSTLPALILFSARGIIIASSWCVGKLRFAARGDQSARFAAIMPYLLVGALVIAGTGPFLRRLVDDPFLRMRRATRGFLEDLESKGVDRGTIFVRASSREALNLETALLGVSLFSEHGPLVFARDRGVDRDRTFADARGTAPAFLLSISDPAGEWLLEPLENRRSFRIGERAREIADDKR